MIRIITETRREINCPALNEVQRTARRGDDHGCASPETRYLRSHAGVTNDDNAAVRLNVIQVGVISFDLQSEGWGDD
jgi:hypothetical protein